MSNRNYIIAFKLIGAALVAVASYVYIDQLVVSWSKINTGRITIDYVWCGLAIFLVCMAYLLFTLAWQVALNGIEEINKKINFYQCLGIYNSTQLAKYIPGKIWGYLLQARVLKNHGINTHTTIYLNILLSLISVLYGIGLGLIYLTYFLGYGSTVGVLLLLIIFSLILLNFYLSKSYRLNKGLEKIAGLLGKEIQIYKIDKKAFILINLIILITVVVWGISGVACAMALGVTYKTDIFLPLISATVFSDAMGFLVLVSPGGIGVREYVLFLMLDTMQIGMIAVFIPVLARLTNMVADLLLGAVGFYSLFREHYKMPSA